MISTAVDVPTTSVAEFRRAAWPILDRSSVGSVVLRHYLTWCALTAGILLTAVGVYGLTLSPGSWGLVAAGVLITAMVALRLRRAFRTAAASRAELVHLSRRIDELAATGAIPVTPPGWEDGVLPAPHERTPS